MVQRLKESFNGTWPLFRNVVGAVMAVLVAGYIGFTSAGSVKANANCEKIEQIIKRNEEKDRDWIWIRRELATYKDNQQLQLRIIKSIAQKMKVTIPAEDLCEE